MKTKFLIIISILVVDILLGIRAFTQDIFPTDENGNIVYTEIVTVDSVNAADLFVRANSWFAHSFKSSKDVIQLSDKDAGRILGKGNFQAGIAKGSAGLIKSSMYGTVNLTIEILTKDGRYKYNFTDFTFTHVNVIHDLRSSSLIKNAAWQKKLDQDWIEIKKDIHEKMLIIIDGLKKDMSTDANDW